MQTYVKQSFINLIAVISNKIRAYSKVYEFVGFCGLKLNENRLNKVALAMMW
jgi:hypothetical protein